MGSDITSVTLAHFEKQKPQIESVLGYKRVTPLGKGDKKLAENEKKVMKFSTFRPITSGRM
jgi:hypothetical protein